MRLKVVLEECEEGGYTVYVPSLPGCISEGDDKESALKNIREAISLYLEPIDDEIILNEKYLVEELAFWAIYPNYLICKSLKHCRDLALVL